MSDEKGKKQKSVLERMTEKTAQKVNGAKNGAANMVNRAADFFMEYDGSQTNHEDLGYAIKNANDYVSPDNVEKAENGKDDGKEKARFLQRDIVSNARRTREKRASGNMQLSDRDRNAKIDKFENEIHKEMDRRGCDGLQLTCAGYDIRLVRIPDPDEEGHIQMTLNGKPVYVHPDLEGDEVFIRGSRAEISRKLAEKLNTEMLETGMMRSEKTLADGHKTVCSADIRVDGKRAVVDKNIGDFECVDEPGGWKISRELWEDASSHFNELGTQTWIATAENGRVIECGVQIRVNGKAAIINNNIAEGTVVQRVGRDQPSEISGGDWDKALDAMLQNGTNQYGVTMDDGTTVSYKLVMRVDGEPAEIDGSLDGLSAAKISPHVRIGAGLWDKAMQELMDSPNPSKTTSRTYDDNGRKIECRMDLKVDGKEAAVNRPFEKGTVREGRDGIEIGSDIYNKALEEMDNKRQTIHAEKLDDGREIRFQRPGKIMMYTPDGEEVTEKDYRDCIAEIGKLDEPEKRKNLGGTWQSIQRQFEIQTIRSTAMFVTGLPGNYAVMREGQRSFIAHMLGMAMQEMSRGMAR